jgi:hypothetical protein
LAMKIIILNRKRLGVTAVVLGLMIILFGLERGFDERLKQAALMYSGIDSFVKYEGLNKSFSYKLPKEWSSVVESVSGGEVLYSNRFTSPDKVINGYMQVWSLKGDLKTFLEKSKEISYSQDPSKYKNYDISSIKIKDNEGYLLSYTMFSPNYNEYFKGYEYFIGCKNKFFRFSFFVNEKNFKETMPNVFLTIAETLEHTH